MAATHPRAVIITALPIERTAVIEHLRDYREESHPQGSVYRRGIFDENSEPWDVLVAEIGAGNEGAAAEAERAIGYFSPQVAIFVGVAGAIKDLSHGDVVASAKVYNYGYGKETDSGFEPRPETELPGYSLRERAKYEAGEADWRRRIRPSPGVPALAAEPIAKLGPIAAGPKVVASTRSATFAFLRQCYGDAVAVEMEGHGFLLGVRMNHPVQGIVIRSISDCIGDKTPHGDRDWQPVAARHAAAFAFQILAKVPRGEIAAPRHAAVPDEGSQQVRIGDITGTNVSVNISQHHGPLTQVVNDPSFSGNAEIDLAVEKLKQGEPDIAIYLLSKLRRGQWDRLTARERFRLVANLGHCEQSKGNLREAARYFIDAKQHQPQDESARSLEAVGYSLLGEEAKALDLANAVLAEYPTASLALAVRIKCLPKDTPFADIDRSIPEAPRDSVDVLYALSWRAFASGEVAAAERIARTALRSQPDSMELRDQLGTAILQAEGIARRDGDRAPCRARLTEAVDALSFALAKVKGKHDVARIRHARAEAYVLLDRFADAEDDFRAAWEAAKDDKQIPLRFAVFLEKRQRRDAAIEVLQKATEDVFEPQIAMMLASLLGERAKPGDRALAIRLMQQALKDGAAVDADTRAGFVATLMHLYATERQFQEALHVLDSLSSGYVTEVTGLILRAESLGRAGKKDDALAFAKKALHDLTPDSSDQERLRVADVLRFLGEHRDALGIWKRILKPTQAEFFVPTALDSARRAGDDGYILSFCKALRSNGVHSDFCLELEVVTLERYACFDDAIALMRQYLANPANDALARIFRTRLSLIGLRLGRHDLIVTDLTLLPSPDSALPPVGCAVVCILHHHAPKPEIAVKYAYELLRQNFLNPDVRQVYFGAIGVGDELMALFPQPECVAPGCAVEYRPDDATEAKWIIIEDESVPRPECEEIGTEHPWAIELQGKKVGDSFYVRRDALQDRTATVLGIHSKYVYRKMEVLNTWEERFPGIFFVRKYNFGKKEDGSLDISQFLRSLDLQEQQTEKLNSVYREHPLSVTTFAQLSRKDLLESLQHLAFEGSLAVRCCLGNGEELQAAMEALGSGDSLAIDPSALATLFFSGNYEDLPAIPPKCVLCESALHDYRDLQRELSAAPAGFVAKHKGKYLWKADDPADRARHQERVATFLTKLRAAGTIESGRALAELELDTREELIALFGRATAETLAMAKNSGFVLWTDDFAVALYAREKLGIRRVWTQPVFEWLATTEKVPAQTFVGVTLFLLRWSYFFTRIYPDSILHSCRDASWDPDSPVFAPVLKWFAAPELNDQGAATVCAGALALIWRNANLLHQGESVTRSLLKAILGRQNGRVLVAMIRGGVGQFFGFDVVNHGRCLSVIDSVLQGRTASGLILPDENWGWR